MRSARRSRLSAFTLVELIVSVAVTSILLAGMTSVLLVASRALPDESRPTDKVIEESRVTDQIVGELEQALYFTERTTHAVTFTVADRNGDGSPERIRYAWSGVAGDPLTRQYNNEAALTVLDAVRAFDLAYDLKSVTEQYAGLTIESAEVTVSSNSMALLTKEYKIDATNWLGQYFQPQIVALPTGRFWWRLTRVTFQAKGDATLDGQTRVQIRTANADQTPSSTILEEKTLYESSLSGGYTTQSITFDNTTGLGPNDALCLAFQYGCGPAYTMRVRYDDLTGSGREYTADAGVTWNYLSIGALYYAVYGKICTPGAAQAVTRQYVTGVRVTLQGNAEQATCVELAARTVNAPEVLSAVWETDFSTSPTTLDMNVDGVGDWITHDGTAFNLASLSGGVWRADKTLDSNPGNDFTAVTTLDAIFRDTTTGGGGAAIWLPADRSGSTYGAIWVRVNLHGDNTQTLTLDTKLDATTDRRLVAVANLPAGWVKLRLLVDPSLDSVNVRVNGEDRGTYAYLRYSGDMLRAVQIYPLSGDTGVDFDYVRVRVGGS
jgi:hypothetical protein